MSVILQILCLTRRECKLKTLNCHHRILKMTQFFHVKIVLSVLQPVRKSFIYCILVSSCFVSPGFLSKFSLYHFVNRRYQKKTIGSLWVQTTCPGFCFFCFILCLTPGCRSCCSIRRQQAGSYHQSEEADPRGGSAPLRLLSQPDPAGATFGL